MRTLVDTTSLIALAQYDNAGGYRKYFLPHAYRMYKDSREYLIRYLMPGLDSLILYDAIIVDSGSFKRNLAKTPSLRKLESIATFIHTTEEEITSCYNSAADVLGPLLVNPGKWLIDALRRHIEPLDTVELAIDQNIHFFPSTYWDDLAKELSAGEHKLTRVLEQMLGKNKPFSGAGLANLVRLFYYLVAQEEYQCSISLNPMKAIFLSGMQESRWDIEPTQDRISRTIVDAFDSTIKDEYLQRQEKWLGGRDLSFRAPILFDYVDRRTRGGKGIIATTLEIRDSREAKEFRKGVSALAEEIDRSSDRSVNLILSDLEKMTVTWQEKMKTPSRRRHRKINLNIPFITGLGDRITNLIPKRVETPSEKIFTFLHAMADE
jgi:hypothetical protein